MLYHASSPRRDRTAIAISIALHCCVLILIALAPRPAFTPDVVDERVLLARMISIEHRAPPRVAVVRATAPAPIVASPLERPLIHVAHADAHATRALIVATERGFTDRPVAAAAKPARAVTAPALLAAEPQAFTVAATPIPTPTASPTPQPAAVAHEEGIGNFGEDYPAKVDPQARGALFAGIPETVQIRVTVDENGRAVAIEFVRAPADPALVQELRSRLMAARFIPAVCNGLRCVGTVPLHN
jgi:hypothetical protein